MDVVGDEETPEAVRNTNSYEEIKLRKLYAKQDSAAADNFMVNKTCLQSMKLVSKEETARQKM